MSITLNSTTRNSSFMASEERKISLDMSLDSSIGTGFMLSTKSCAVRISNIFFHVVIHIYMYLMT